MSNKRNYGIDLLRLVLMYMVCMLHTLGQGGVLKASSAETWGFKAFWFLEIFSYCAVDGFAIISGYMAVNKPRKYEKIADMWFQAFFYSFVITLILTVSGLNGGFDWRELIKCMFPVTFGKFWYVTAYFALFFAIPILNKFIFAIDENTAKKALILIVVIFSFMGVVADSFRTSWGYSAIWLIALYLIGAFAKKIGLFEGRKSITLVLLWALCIFGTWGLRLFFGVTNVVKYNSPMILLSAMIMVVLFSRLNLKGTIIAKLSPLAFGIYLFQLNQVVWSKIIKGAFAFVGSKGAVIGVLYVLALALAIFVSGLIVEFVRSKLEKLLRTPLLSKKIVTLFDKLITKAFVLLK